MIRIPGLRWASVASPFVGLLGMLLIAAAFVRASLMVNIAVRMGPVRPSPATPTLNWLGVTPWNVGQTAATMALGTGLGIVALRMRRAGTPDRRAKGREPRRSGPGSPACVCAPCSPG